VRLVGEEGECAAVEPVYRHAKEGSEGRGLKTSCTMIYTG
jgi:hypothetical protein